MTDLRTHFGGFGNRLFQLAYIYSQARSGATPDIYLQDPKYFEAYKEELRALFGGEISPINMVSLHVRRGDYTNNSFYVDLTKTDYYERAMEQFPNSRFLVFCADRQEGSNDKEDMEWCMRQFTGPQFEFWQGTNEVDDFNAQAACEGHITANSSFSWMSAFVGGGKTVSPKSWYSDGRPGITPLDNWITL